MRFFLIDLATYVAAVLIGAAALMFFVASGLAWGYTECLDVTIGISVLFIFFEARQEIRDSWKAHV